MDQAQLGDLEPGAAPGLAQVQRRQENQLAAVANEWIDFFDPLTPLRPARFYRLISSVSAP